MVIYYSLVSATESFEGWNAGTYIPDGSIENMWLD